MCKKTFRVALKTCAPVMFGLFPTGIVFGLMMVSAGYQFLFAPLMSVIVYAGAAQFLAVQLLTDHAPLLQVAIVTFLINSKHLFYGLSLIKEYEGNPLRKLYLIYSLTDETYALLTSPRPADVDSQKYCVYISFINQSSWVLGTLFGAGLGSFVRFNMTGMDFALTALFIVIIIEQLKSYKTKIPFTTGILAALAAYFIVGKENMLLGGIGLSVLILMGFRKRVEGEQEYE